MIEHVLIHFDWLHALIHMKGKKFRSVIRKATSDELRSIFVCVKTYNTICKSSVCTALRRLVSLRKWQEDRIRRTIGICEKSTHLAVCYVLKKLVEETVQNVVCSC